MKFALALFLGVVSTSDLQVQELRDRVNALKIHISEAGQKAIEKEAEDVGKVAKKIQHSRPVRNLHSSLKKWADSAEVAEIKELDAKFLKTPKGKNLMREW